MASTKKLDELFHHTLQDIYYAEKQILKARANLSLSFSISSFRIDLVAERKRACAALRCANVQRTAS